MHIFIGRGREYPELPAGTARIAIGDLDVRVLDLPILMAIKEEVGHAKELAALPLLRATLRERGG